MMTKNSLFLTLLASSTLLVGACDKDEDSGGGASSAGSGDAGAGDEGGADVAGDEAADEAGDEAADEAGDEAADEAGDEAADETGEDEAGDEGGTTGGGFVVEPDGGGGSIECDIWAQDCAEGEKCMPWANDGGNSWNSTTCSPVSANPKQEGDECQREGDAVDNCDKSMMCWDVNEEGNGTCVAFCTGSEAAPMCNPGQTCTIANGGVLILCLPSCDPLAQDCSPGQACYPITDGFVCAPDASGEEMGGQGDPCMYINACDAGLACLTGEFVPDCASDSCCSAFCELPDSGDCPGDSVCDPWYEEGMAPPGYENLGACIIPE